MEKVYRPRLTKREAQMLHRAIGESCLRSKNAVEYWSKRLDQGTMPPETVSDWENAYKRERSLHRKLSKLLGTSSRLPRPPAKRHHSR